MTGALAVLAGLAGSVARRSTTSIGLLVVDVAVGRGVGCELLRLVDGCCVLYLRLPTGTMKVAAPTACASAPRSITVIDLCIAVTGARLDTVRVVLDKVVDIVVEICISLPVVAPVAVLLIRVYMHRAATLRVRSEEKSSARRRVDGDSTLIRLVETVRRGVRPLLGTLQCKLGAVRLGLLLVALQGI